MDYVQLAGDDNNEVRSARGLNLEKSDILQWFKKSSAADSKWVLERLAELRPHLFPDTFEVKRPSRLKRLDTVQDTTISAKNVQQHTGTNHSDDHLPVVQFTARIYTIQEGGDSGMVVLDVMRVGSKEGTSEVFYETQDFSALQGRSYEATSGKLVFEPGESLLHIEIPIIDNPLWDTTTEFLCCLKSEGLKGAMLGHHLHQARIKIIDDDAFPTPDFKHLKTPEDIQECPKFPLLFGVFQMLANIPRVWPGTLKYVLVDVVHNLWYFMDLVMNVYLLDSLVNTTTDKDDLILIHDKFWSLVAFAFINMASVAISHWLDYVRLGFAVNGPTRKFLQAGLLRRFLNYKQIVRERLPGGDVIMGIERHAQDLISSGYSNFLALFSTLGKIFASIIFKVLSNYITGGGDEGPHLRSLGLLFVMPAMLIVFLRCRESATSKAFVHRDKALAALASQIHVTEANCDLVVDYSLRNHCEQLFLDKQDQYAKANSAANRISMNNSYFCNWCKSLVMAIWLVYGGHQVIHEDLSVGLFVTNLKLFDSLGSSYADIYKIIINLMNTFPALVNITTLFNLQTDVGRRCSLEKGQRLQARRYYESLMMDFGSDTIDVAIDMIPIKFNFQSPFTFEGKDHTSLKVKGSAHVHQGQLVALVGPAACGKATLLKVLSGTVLPEEGREAPIFVPPHLRVANVSDTPLFFGGTLYDNLIWGMDKTHHGASRKRVMNICKLLIRSPVILDHLDLDIRGESEESWEDHFSGSECRLLAIARALVQNYEVLCIHHLAAKLPPDDATHVLKTLRSHVESKGLELSSEAAHRRPRTVFVTASKGTSEAAMSEVHDVLMIDSDFKLKLLSEGEFEIKLPSCFGR